jgi:hypothetical protein
LAQKRGATARKKLEAKKDAASKRAKRTKTKRRMSRHDSDDDDEEDDDEDEAGVPRRRKPLSKASMRAAALRELEDLQADAAGMAVGTSRRRGGGGGGGLGGVDDDAAFGLDSDDDGAGAGAALSSAAAAAAEAATLREIDGGDVAEAGKGGRGTKGGKSGKGRGKLSDDEIEAMARMLLEKMALAAQADRRSRKKGLPALKKLALLPEVRRVVRNTSLHETLLEGIGEETGGARGTSGGTTILALIREWLRPLQGAQLPELNVRSAMYQLLSCLPIEAFHIRSSRLGPVIAALQKHPDETPENKKLLQTITQTWVRAALGKGVGYRDQMDMVLAAEAEALRQSGVDTVAASMYDISIAGPGVVGGGSAATSTVASAAAESEQGLAAAGQRPTGSSWSSSAGASAGGGDGGGGGGATLLARRPVARGLNFLRRPTRAPSGFGGSGVEEDGMGMGGGHVVPLPGASVGKDSIRGRLKRSRQALRRQRLGKTTSDHTVSIEGRGTS